MQGGGSGTVFGNVNGVGTNACFSSPYGIAVDTTGNIIVSDSGSNNVRVLKPISTCPEGYYCFGGAIISQCSAGSFCPVNSTAPIPCAAGSYAPVTSRATCLLCPPGSWTAVNGSSFCDQFCLRGYASADMGGSSINSCTACKAGSYGKSEGASVCTQCPVGTSSSVIAAISLDTCIACLPGTFASSGSSSCSLCPTGSFPDATQSSCLIGVYSCPSGYTSNSPNAPTSFISCVPLECPSPLAFSTSGGTTTNTSCRGCAVNSSGMFPNCIACPVSSSNLICPGITAAPLISFSSSAGLAVSPLTTACPPLTGPARLTPSIVTKSSFLLGYPKLTNILSVDSVIISGITFCLISILLFSIAHFLPPSLIFVTDFLTVFLKRFDAFSKAVTGPSPGAALINKPRRIGGACSILGGISFLTLALVLTLQRAAKNVNTQRSVVVLDDTASLAAASLPIYSAPPWGSGIKVVITASGDNTACAIPITWSAVDLGWAYKSTVSCAASGASQLVFSCSDCVFTSASAIDITLHYSCQSLLIEAGALDGSGVVTSFALPTSKTVATGGSLLSSISWTLPTLLSVVNSTVSPSYRGFTLTSGPSNINSQLLLPTANGDGLIVTPNTASVALHIAFPLNTFFSMTILTETQSITALLSTIVGLAGIFSLFGTLLRVIDVASAYSCKRTKLNQKIVLLVSDRPVDQIEKKEGTFNVSNPLVNPTLITETVEVVPNEEKVWHIVSDEDNQWYVNDAGDSEWTLPDGAILAPS